MSILLSGYGNLFGEFYKMNFNWRVSFLSFALTAVLGGAAFGQVTGGGQTGVSSSSWDGISSRGYQVGPGDVIEVRVLGEPQFDFVAAVDENGVIEMPFDEHPLKAQCKTERELRSEVTTALAKYLRTPQVTARITQRKSRPPVTVSGAVRTPQMFDLQRRVRLQEILYYSGGASEDAGNFVQIIRTQKPICIENAESYAYGSGEGLDTVPVRVFAINQIGGTTEDSNPTIFPGDVIEVKKAPPIYITGEVRAPQGVYLRDEMTLTQVLAMVGGVNPKSKTKDIKIYRLKPNSKERELISVNLDKIKKSEQKDVMLQAYDIVEVDKAPKTALDYALGFLTNVSQAAAQSAGTSVIRPLY